MNFSRNVSLLKTIDATLDDKIYLGVTESKALLSSIDSNLVTIDSVLDNLYTNSGTANTHLSTIETKATAMDTSLNNIESSASNIDTSLNNMESDIDSVNSKLVDIGVTLAANDKFNVDARYAQLQNGGSGKLDAADYSSTTGKLSWENNLSEDVLIKKISLTFHSSETTWDKIFTSTASGANSYVEYGIGNDATGIDTSKLKFSNNRDIQPYMTMVFSDPGAADDMYYSYVVDGLNIKLQNGEFFVCELKGNYSASGDESFASSEI